MSPSKLTSVQVTVSVPCAGDIAVLQKIADDVGAVKQQVANLEGIMNESSSRTVPASAISQQKLDKLYNTLNINLSPMDAVGAIEARLLQAVVLPASTDGLYIW